MARCRCDDIRKINLDLATMADIQDHVNKLINYDSQVVTALEKIGNYSDATFFSTDSFGEDVKKVNGSSTDDIAALSAKVQEKIDWLNDQLTIVTAMDQEWHDETRMYVC